MTTTFKDVAHLYLGGNIQVEYEGRVGNIFTYYHPAGKFNVDRIWVCSLEEDGNPEMSCSAPVDKVKPILRKLDSMTEEEAMDGGWTNKRSFDSFVKIHQYDDTDQLTRRWFAQDFIYLLSRGFDLFGLIDSDQAIDASTI